MMLVIFFQDWRKIIQARQLTLETLTLNEDVGKDVEFTDFSICQNLKHLSFYPYFNTFRDISKLSNLERLEIRLPRRTANCQLEKLPEGSLPQLSSLSVFGRNGDVDISRALACICAATNLTSLECKLDGQISHLDLIRILKCASKIGSR